MTSTASPHPLSDLSVLDQFASAPFPPGYPSDRRTFYSPVDDVHGALKFVIASAQRSVVLAMYGFDDDELAAILKTKLEDDKVYVQFTLDSTQAGGVHEKALLATENYPSSSVAIGRSEKGAIMHLKHGVVDGTILFDGSTNWSNSGEALQDNQLTISIDPVAAGLATARIGAIHAHMLQKAAAS
jgi:phosphatidylserine/phosphatidylglycerophosphate/cardiolipin synthase-like enzyme